MRFLFYLEREFHLDLMRNLILYISKHKLGRIGLWSPLYRESNLQQINLGCSRELVAQCLPSIDLEWFESKPDSFNADICIMADSSYEAVEGLGFIVNIGHGTICKGSFYTNDDLSKRENCADLLCVPSELHYQVMKKHIWTNMIVAGMPKFDELKDYPLSKSEIMKKLNLDPTKKTVLFAPTFNPEFSIVPYIQDKFRHYIPDLYNIIIKLHGVSPKEWAINYKNLSVSSKNIALISDYSVVESFIVSDVIVSDVSSIAYEFASFNKPALVYNSPLQKRHPKYNPDDLEYKYRRQLLEFSNLAQIPELLSKCLSESYQIKTSFLDTSINSSETIINSAIGLSQNKKDTYLLYSIGSDESIKRNALLASRLNIPLLLIKPDLKASPYTDRLMLNQFKFNKMVDVVCPLIYKEEYPEQNIFRYFPETANIPVEYLVNPLSYRNSFKAKRIGDFSEECFMVRTEILAQYLASEQEDSIEGLKSWIQINDKRVYVCLDTLIY